MATSQLRGFWFGGRGWTPGICISNKVPEMLELQVWGLPAESHCFVQTLSGPESEQIALGVLCHVTRDWASLRKAEGCEAFLPLVSLLLERIHRLRNWP